MSAYAYSTAHRFSTFIFDAAVWRALTLLIASAQIVVMTLAIESALGEAKGKRVEEVRDTFKALQKELTVSVVVVATPQFIFTFFKPAQPYYSYYVVSPF